MRETSVSRRRAKFWKQSCGLCHYCGVKTHLEGKPTSPSFATIDHVVAKSAGGSGLPHNKVLACYACNQSKKSKSAEEFLQEDLLHEEFLLEEPTPELVALYVARESRCFFCGVRTILWWDRPTIHRACLRHGHLTCLGCAARGVGKTLYEMAYGEGVYYGDQSCGVGI